MPSHKDNIKLEYIAKFIKAYTANSINFKHNNALHTQLSKIQYNNDYIGEMTPLEKTSYHKYIL